MNLDRTAATAAALYDCIVLQCMLPKNIKRREEMTKKS